MTKLLFFLLLLLLLFVASSGCIIEDINIEDKNLEPILSEELNDVLQNQGYEAAIPAKIVNACSQRVTKDYYFILS